MSTERYHVVGIGGVGMAPLAELLVSLGHPVSGSDRAVDRGAAPEVVKRLAAQGVRICEQDGSGVRAGPDAVVVSTAIEPDNPDLVAARAAGIPVLHRAAVLAGKANPHELIAVAGTCGKTTVTAMVGWVLDQAGLDPVVVNGGATVGWDSAPRTGSTRTGGGGPWVVEVDESDRSLLQFEPDWALITNVSADHFSEAESLALFADFAGRVSGPVVTWRDLAATGGALDAVTAAGGGSDFLYKGRRFHVPLPGRHNVENGLLSVLFCERFGLELDPIVRALGRFPGVRRRLERVPGASGLTVIDDYAHNTMKIRAGLEAMQAAHPRVHAVWRPHGYGPLRNMLDDLAAMFCAVCRAEDRLYLLPVYDAGGTADRRINSDALATAIARGGGQCACVPDADAALAAVCAAARPGDAVLVMGARDPDLPALARRIAAGAGV